MDPHCGERKGISIIKIISIAGNGGQMKCTVSGWEGEKELGKKRICGLPGGRIEEIMWEGDKIKIEVPLKSPHHATEHGLGAGT